MKDQIKIAIVTILIFVSGVLTGIWTQHAKTPPPPPFGHFPEFGNGPMGIPGECPPPPPEMRHDGRGFMPPEDMEKMKEKMEKLKPQMEEFKKKLDTIKDKSKAKIVAVLNDEQKAKFNEIQTRRDQMIQHIQKERPPMGFGKGGPAPMIEHFEFLSTVIYKPLLDRMTQDLKLDDKQQKAIDEILAQRRKEVLELLDVTPPPSMEIWDKKPRDHRGPEARQEFGRPQGPDDRRAPDAPKAPQHP